MFDFELLKNEEIIIIDKEGLLKCSDSIKEVSVVITNQRFLIFSIPIDIEAFRFGKMIDNFKASKLELLFEAKLSEFDKIINEGSFDKYVLKNTNYFYLKDENVKDYIKTLL